MSVAIAQLSGAKITTGPQAWQVLQREADGCATLMLAGTWVGESPSTVEVRVANEANHAPAPGCDWQDAEMLDENAWQITLRVPTGGLYRVETRVRAADPGWRNTGDKIMHIAVGDLWVIAGQSNAVGYGHGIVTDPPMLGVSVFGSDEEWELASHPIFDPTNSLHPANYDPGWVDVSPWLAFGKAILQHAGVPVGLIPVALGGSPLSAWEPANGEQATLYHNMVDMIEKAGGRIAGMVWYQGCTDTAPETAGTYLERFIAFIEAWRKQYGAELPVITAQLNRFLMLPEDVGDLGWSLVREAQRRAARLLPNLAVVPTLDLGLSDLIHNSAVGNVTLGERFAWMARGMVYGEAIRWKPVDVQRAYFADDSRTKVIVELFDDTGWLVQMATKAEEYVVEDQHGVIPFHTTTIVGSEIHLVLARPADGPTQCHCAIGCKPPSTVRDQLQRPPLAFYGVEVEEAQQ